MPVLLVQTVQMQFLDKVIDVSVSVQRHVPMVVETVQFLDMVIDVPVAVQRHVPMVFEAAQFLDKVIDVLVAVRHVPLVVQTVQFLDNRCSYSARSLTRPLCATTEVMVQTVQFLDKVVVLCPLSHDRCTWFQTCRKRLEVPQMQFCVTCLLGVELGAYGGVYGDGAVDGFSRIFRIFRAPPGCPGVERQCQLVFDFQPVSCACG